MTHPSTTGPMKIEKIHISKQRSINIKLWGPSNHPQWGLTRSTIEIQEARKNEEGQMSYGKAIRLPCDGSASILANYLSSFLIKGRDLNKQINLGSKSIQSESKSVSAEMKADEIEKVLVKQFKNQKLSKTRILQTLSANGIEIDGNTLLDVLELLVDNQQVSKESAIHTGSGNTYTLWHFV